jgi:chitinase
MADMLLAGFPVAGDPERMFPPLKQEQIVIGLAADPDAVNGGYTSPREMQNALKYLAGGRSFGGIYPLQDPAGYTSLRGVMTWSINWDAARHHTFSNTVRACLEALP